MLACDSPDVAQVSRPAQKLYVQLLRRPGGLRHAGPSHRLFNPATAGGKADC